MKLMKRKTNNVPVNVTDPIDEYLSFQDGQRSTIDGDGEWPSLALPSSTTDTLKNNPDYKHGPIKIYTDEEIEEYMKERYRD